MQTVYTNKQMRQSDEYTIHTLGVPSAILMDRAGQAIAQEVMGLLTKLNKTTVCVVCGCGNNGGDGYVCAQYLLSYGVDAHIYAMQGNLSADCLRVKSAYTGGYTTGVSADIIVDCIFGTGLSREVTGEAAQLISTINQSGAFVVAADIPSGLNGDNGQVMGVAVKADTTVAIAELKTGFYLGDGKDYCGEIVQKDIGITPVPSHTFLVDETKGKSYFPKRKQNSHKGTFGTVQLVVGSAQYMGAALLSSGAAMRSGCGYVRIQAQENTFKSTILLREPQVVCNDEPELNAQAMVVGSGCGVSKNLYQTLCHLLQNYQGKLVIDADGLNALATYGVQVLKGASCQVLVTPHVKEFSRLTNLSVQQILQDPVGSAQAFAKEYGVTVLLKGATTVITDGENTLLSTTGNSALAKAGSGDMLAGFIGGTAARGLNLLDSATAGAFVLGKAAELASQTQSEYAVTANEILSALPKVIKCLTK